jgi:broad-specificity NMP kinase
MDPMLVWVTGLSGTGKSAVAARLRELGHRSVDADDDGMSVWRSHETGAIVPSSPVEQRPADWLDRFGWSIDVQHVQGLRDSADGGLVFHVGAVENEAEVLVLADVVVCLVADADTLRQRLATRRANDFGKAPGDVDAVLSRLGVYEERHAAIGAVMVDATQPFPVVVAEVLAAASVP